MQKQSSLLLWAALASATLAVMAGSILGPIVNKMKEPLGASTESIGLVITTHGLFIALSSPFLGYLIDKIGRKKVYLAGLFTYGVSGGLGFFITSFWLMILTRAVLGVGVAGIVASITTMLADVYKGKELQKVMGYRSSAESLGGTIFPLIGGFLGVFAWNFPFLLYFLALPLGAIVWWKVPETKSKGKKQTEVGSVSFFKMLWNNRFLFYVYVLIFLAMLNLYVVVVFVPQQLGEFGIKNTFEIGLFLMFLSGTGALASLAHGYIKSLASYTKIVSFAFAFWILGFSTSFFSSNFWTLIPSLILVGVSQGLAIPTAYVLATSSVEASLRGQTTSYLSSFGYLGQFMSPVIYGPIAGLIDLKWVFGASSIVNLICLLLILTYVKINQNKM